MSVFDGCNKLDSGTRVHQNTWGRVSQAWKGGWKIDNEVQSFHSNKGFQCGCQCIHRQTMGVLMHMCSAFPTGKMEQMIMTLLCDSMRISCAVKGREL